MKDEICCAAFILSQSYEDELKGIVACHLHKGDGLEKVRR